MTERYDARMLLVILAAGKGLRLGKITEEIPKPLVQLADGKTILDKQIRTAIKSKLIDEIIIVTGYKADQIENKIADYEKEIRISTQYNPYYNTAGPVVSLWTVSQRMKEADFIIVNGDTVYTSKVYETIAKSVHQSNIELVISVKAVNDQDDVKVKKDINNYLVKVNKNLPAGQYDACSAGFLVVKGPESRRNFLNELNNMIRLNNNLMPGEPWHDIVNNMAAGGFAIKAIAVNSKEWKEIDSAADLEECYNEGI